MTSCLLLFYRTISTFFVVFYLNAILIRSLRPRRHELVLTTKRGSRNFFERQLFKDMYWHIVQLLSVNCFSKIEVKWSGGAEVDCYSKWQSGCHFLVAHITRIMQSILQLSGKVCWQATLAQQSHLPSAASITDSLNALQQRVSYRRAVDTDENSWSCWRWTGHHGWTLDLCLVCFE